MTDRAPSIRHQALDDRLPDEFDLPAARRLPGKRHRQLDLPLHPALHDLDGPRPVSVRVRQILRPRPHQPARRTGRRLPARAAPPGLFPAGEEAGDARKRLLRRRHADPLDPRRAKVSEPFERQRQMRAALVRGQIVDLVDDHFLVVRSIRGPSQTEAGYTATPASSRARPGGRRSIAARSRRGRVARADGRSQAGPASPDSAASWSIASVNSANVVMNVIVQGFSGE